MNRPSYLLFKKCSKCGEILHVSKFHKQKDCKYGVCKVCKECKSKYKKKWREDNIEKIKEYNKEYNKNNKEKIKEYLEEHKEERKKYYKKWKKENPEKRFNNHNKRRNKLDNQGNGITKEQWYEMMEFFNWRCAYSDEYIGGDSDKRTIDHIVALDNGGEHEIWNCVPMYANYNYSKSTKNMLEWYLEQEFFSIERLTKIYEWRIYAYWKWKE